MKIRRRRLAILMGTVAGVVAYCLVQDGAPADTYWGRTLTTFVAYILVYSAVLWVTEEDPDG